MKRSKLAGIPRTALEQGICPALWTGTVATSGVHCYTIADGWTEKSGLAGMDVFTVHQCVHCGDYQYEKVELDYSLTTRVAVTMPDNVGIIEFTS